MSRVTANVQLDEKLWTDMIERVINKEAKYLTDVDFWVELKEMYDKQGNLYYQAFPRFAANFK